MSQHDFNIANQSFPATRTDLNNALVALASNSSGDAEPATKYANQWWYETDTNTLKLRNEANDAWISIAVLDQSGNAVQSITTAGLTLGSTAISATGTEINLLDAITRGSILYGNASGATARLAKGGAGTVLTSDGTDISWAAAGGGGMEFIASSGAISNAASVEFTGFDASKYDSYKLFFMNVLPATDTAMPSLRLSVDGGSNYLSASDSYSSRITQLGAAGDQNMMPLAYYKAGNDASADGGVSGTVDILGAALNAPTIISPVIQIMGDNGIPTDFIGGSAKTKAATVVNACQVLFHSGNIASGEITFFGIVKA